ncbi:MAG: DUF4203 domain-containing protein [Thermoanaerobaculia bacterium]|nr:DUF4203 domain-containing protein [Thermoanaerobaculia bacterium]
MSELSPIVLWVAGGLLLVAGRRLYWLFVGVAGFVVGFLLAERLGLPGPDWAGLLAALLLGALAAMLAVFFQKVAVGAVGFLGGAALALVVGDTLAWGLSGWIWLVALVCGVVGAVLTRALFELSLVLLSSLAGASLVVQGAGWTDPEATVALLLLAGAGILVQLVSGRGRRRRKG